MKTNKKPLMVRTTPLFQFEKKQSALPETTHPTTITITTSTTGFTLPAEPTVRVKSHK